MKPGVVDGLVNFLHGLREYGLEFVSGRYYGKYGGLVTDTDDPQGQGRVLVSCELATGRSEALSLWAYPSAVVAGRNHGLFMPPEVGDRVWVWFDHGDVTQPRVSGSWWVNSSAAKTRAGGQIPAEFKSPGAPSRRGYKSKRGHGFFFEDDVEVGSRFELWTGDQSDPDNVADRHHQFVMDDTEDRAEIRVESFGGQKTRWIDVDGLEAVETTTVSGLFLKLLDALKRIEMGTPGGFTVSVDETTGTIQMLSPTGKTVAISETASTITVTDGLNSVSLSPVGVNVASPTLVNVASAGAMTLGAGAAAALVAGGLLAITGAGMAITSSGGGPATSFASGVTNNTFIGLKTETLAGGLIQAVAGLWSVAAVIVEIVSISVALGSPGAKFVIMDARMIPVFNAHTHEILTPIPGQPTSAPLTQLAAGLHTTSAVTAN